MSFIQNGFSKYQSLIEVSKPDQPVMPDLAFLEALGESNRKDFEALFALLKDGKFPDLWDFTADFGADTSRFANVDDGVYGLANDGAGNYFVLYPEGHVDIWCHDEGGYMEGREFESLSDAFECVVLATLAKSGEVSWDELSPRFAEKAPESEGWTFFQEDVIEYLED